MTRLTAALMLMLIPVPNGAFAQEEAVAVPLTNPGFEEGAAGWDIGRFPELIKIDDTVARSGQRSLRISDPAGQSMPWAPQGVSGLQGGAVYTFRAWYRTPENADDRWSAALKIEFYNDAGANTLGQYTRSSQPTAGEWRLLELTAEAPPDTTRAAVLVRLFGPGTVWFDDCELVQVQPPPVVVLHPPRQVVKPGQRTVTFTVRPAQAWDEAEPPIRIMVYDDEDNVVEADMTLELRDDGTWQAMMTLPELAPGSYRVEAGLGRKPSDTARLFVPLRDRKPAMLSDTGTILVDGEPFFPIGLYHAGGNYRMLADAGFNAVQGSNTMDLDRLGESLDAAAAAGLMVDVPLYWEGRVAENLETSLQKLERYADHPAVLCWKIIDEPDIRPDITDEVPDAYAALRAADPMHPIELTLCRPSGFSYWANFCDIMQVDPYPLPRQPLTMVSDWVDTAMAGLEPWQNLTAVLQCGWTHNPFNQPTPEQARCMVYLALIHGAKGIFWYSFRDPGWRLEETPLWEHFPAINAETLELSRPVLSGEPDAQVEVSSPDDVVHWRAWRYDGKTWLLLANPGEKPITAQVTPGGPCVVRDLSGEDLGEFEDGFEVTLPAFGALTRVLTRG